MLVFLPYLFFLWVVVTFMFWLENKAGKYFNQKGKKNDTITLALRKKNCYSV